MLTLSLIDNDTKNRHAIDDLNKSLYLNTPCNVGFAACFLI
jgi:hypothetical protein